MQSNSIEICIKQDCMKMVRHHYIRRQAQVTVVDAIPEGANQNLNGFFLDEYREPVGDGERDEVNSNSLYNSVAAHVNNYR